MTPILKIKRLHPDAQIPDYKTALAAGMDLYVSHPEMQKLEPGRSLLVHTGIAVEIPPGYEGQVRPRSSISRMALVLPTGTIDADYRGEVGIVVINTSPETVSIRAGDRLGQLVIGPVARCEVVEVEDLSETVRGAGGFGSTGR